jgi:pimeloyl-ACP methyl ester carboxylesterase
MSPRDAATLPTDRPATEVPTAPSRPAPPLPEPLPEIPTMPKEDLVPGTKEMQVQQANPLKDHLQVLDRMALLEKHIEAGTDREKLKAEISKADPMVLSLNIESFAEVDTLRDLKALTMPALSVHGANDTFLPPPDAEMIAGLKEGRSSFHIIGMESTRHFPMLENIAGFTRLLLDFLEAPDVTKLEIKKTWERRVR